MSIPEMLAALDRVHGSRERTIAVIQAERTNRRNTGVARVGLEEVIEDMYMLNCGQ